MARPKGETLKITKEDLERLYFVENKSTIAIGALYGCDRKNIDYYFKKFDIPKKSLHEAQITAFANKRGTVIDTQYVKEQVALGRLVGDIAKELKVSRGALGEHCKRAGLVFRNHAAQRGKQSVFMSSHNPVPKGSSRDGGVAQKRRATLSGNLDYETLFLTKEALTFQQYAKKARILSYAYYTNNELYSPEKVIDHIFSIKDGYNNGVPVLLISHPMNLRLVSVKENNAKGASSIGSLHDFHIRIGVKR